MRVLLTGYLAFVYVVTTLAIGREQSVPVGPLIVGAVGVLLIVLGGAMGRFQRNWFAGIRTPWTLSSERSWVLTHRLGSRVFVAAGVATLIGAVIGGVWAFVAMTVILLPGTVVLVVYSYLVWRNDPDRLPGPPSGHQEDGGDRR